MENHLNSGQGLAFEGLFQLYREERNPSTFLWRFGAPWKQIPGCNEEGLRSLNDECW